MLLPNPSVGVVLRDYQREALSEIRRHMLAGTKRIMVVMPTGTGKGSVIAQITKGANKQGVRSLFVVHRAHLVDDIAQRVGRYGIGCSIVLPGYISDWNAMTYMSTIQSWLSPARLRTIGAKPRLIIIDECHLINPRDGMYARLAEMYPDATIIGFTATPTRSDGRGLGAFFDVMVHPIGFERSFADGYLVRPRYFTPADAHLKELLKAAKTKGDDLDPEATGPLMEQPKIVGDVVAHYLRYGEDRKAVGFAVRVSHSKALCAAFEAAGIPSAHIDAETPKWERDRIFDALRSGEIKVVWNVNVLAEGLDIPDISCIIDASPTKSIIRWLQRIGRGLRPHGNQRDCIVIDHGGTFDRLGGVEHYETWSLEDKKGANATPKKREEEREKKIKELTCKECATVFSGSIVCPACGYVHDSTKIPEYIQGDLSEITDAKKSKKAERTFSDGEKLDWVRQLNHVAQSRGHKPYWIKSMYESKFKELPPSTFDCVPPTREVLNWIRHQNIKYARSKRYR